MSERFTGRVDQGRVCMDEPQRWLATLGRWNGKRVEVSIRVPTERRSSQQNRWYWSCIVPIAKEVLSQGRVVPLSKDQAHYVLASAFLGSEETPLGTVPIKTSALSTKDFATYCERIVAHAASEWGIAIPVPGERMEAEL